MRRNPFNELEEMLDRIGRQVEEGMGAGGGFPPAESVAVDVRETDAEYVVTADLPGYERDDIELRLLEGSLKLEADRVEETTDAEGEYLRRERTRRAVSRRLRLPEPVDEEAVTARYANGVLTVTLPKVVGVDDSKQIDIE